MSAPAQQREKNGIAYWIHVPEGTTTPRGTVIISHGYAQHSGHYGMLVKELLGHNWSVIAYDLRGHGESAGQRAYITDFNQYLEDIEMLQDIAEKEIATETKSIVLFGHSLGGLITLRYLIKLHEEPEMKERAQHIKACVTSSPFLLTAKPLPLTDRIMVVILSRVKPTFRDPFKPNFEKSLSHDESYVKMRETDKKGIHYSTVGWYVQTRKAQRYVMSHIGALKDLPTLWITAEKDTVVHVPSIKKLVTTLQGLSPGEKHVNTEYPDFYHDIFNELDRSKPEAHFKEFLTKF